MANDILCDGTMAPFEPAAATAFADHDLGSAQFPGLLDQRRPDIICSNSHQRRAKRGGEGKIVGQLVALGAPHGPRTAAFDHHGGPWRIIYVSHPFGMADDLCTTLAGADRDQQPLARYEITLLAARLELVGQAAIHASRRKAQGQFAQGRQLVRREEIRQRSPRGVGQIDFASLEPLDQGFGRQVDNDQLGLVQHPVRNRLPHPDMGEACNDVVQALDMLDIDRRRNVDARIQQFLDILPALGMAASRSVAVSKLVDQYQVGIARQRRVNVKFLETVALMKHDMAG